MKLKQNLKVDWMFPLARKSRTGDHCSSTEGRPFRTKMRNVFMQKMVSFLKSLIQKALKAHWVHIKERFLERNQRMWSWLI